LNDIPVGGHTVRQIETLPLSGPSDSTASSGELLVGVASVTRVDLHQVAICSAAVGNVETLVAVHDERSSGGYGP